MTLAALGRAREVADIWPVARQVSASRPAADPDALGRPSSVIRHRSWASVQELILDLQETRVSPPKPSSK
jgi:hypothetical protein